MSLSKTDSATLQDLNDSGCVQDSSVCDNGFRRQPQLLDLSDDVLLYILKHCTPRDLKALGFTCSRLASLICDRTLWQRVDCRNSEIGQQRLGWLLTHCLGNNTTELKIKGYVDIRSRCLGIQDPASTTPSDGISELMASRPECNLVDNILYRMWYPNLPRLTASPRWPDREELANAEKANKAKALDLNQSSNKMDEDSGASKPGGSAEGQPGGSAQGQPDGLAQGLLGGSAPGQPDGSGQGQPGGSAQGQPGGTAQGQPGGLAQGEPSAVFHRAPDNPMQAFCVIRRTAGSPTFDEPVSLKCDKATNTKPGEENGSNDDEPGSSKDVNPSGSKNGGSPSSKPVEPAGSNGGGRVGDAEPMDVTMEAGPSKAGPDVGNHTKPPTNCSGPQFPFTIELMRSLKYTCSNLTALFIEYCDIDYKHNNLSRFPPKLKKLSLKGTRCYNQPLHSSYLCKIQDYMRDLEYLDVSVCDWFEPASLMPVSKIPKLQQLYMRQCVRLTECVAYASLAARYGFRALRVLDSRGSPLADSEVSALGWLPRLEELYVSPPAQDSSLPEHVHSWTEPPPAFHELDPWEQEEPEYFKSKTCEVPASPPRPQSESTTDPGIAEIRELGPNDAVGDRPWGCYERRIIVIQPTANREMIVQPSLNMPPMVPRRPVPPLVPPQVPPLALIPPLAPVPAAPKRPHGDQALDLVKRPRLDGGINLASADSDDSDDSDESANRPNNGVKRTPAGPSHPGSGGNRQREGSNRTEGGAIRPQACPTRPESRATGPKAAPNRTEGGSNHAQAGPSRPESGANRPHALPNRPEAGPSRPEGINRPREPPAGPLDGANRPPHGPNRPEDGPPVYRQQFRVTSRYIGPNRGNDAAYRPDGWIEAGRPEGLEDIIECAVRHQDNGCPLAEGDNRGGRLAIAPPAAAAHVFMRFGNSNNDMHVYHSHNYDLVTDSSVFRFGRGDNEQVVNLGAAPAEDSRARPDRSSLRVLSVTGFRNITDRSLVHLASAAPNLRRIDFTQTNVTDRGVEIFKAMRPDCEIVHSKFADYIK